MVCQDLTQGRGWETLACAATRCPLVSPFPPHGKLLIWDEYSRVKGF